MQCFLYNGVPYRQVVTSYQREGSYNERYFARLYVVRFFVVRLPRRCVNGINELTGREFWSNANAGIRLRITKDGVNGCALFAGFSNGLRDRCFLLPWASTRRFFDIRQDGVRFCFSVQVAINGVVFHVNFRLRRNVIANRLYHDGYVLGYSQGFGAKGPVVNVVRFVGEYVSYDGQAVENGIRPAPANERKDNRFVGEVVQGRVVRLRVFGLRVNAMCFNVYVGVNDGVRPTFFFFRLRANVMFESLRAWANVRRRAIQGGREYSKLRIYRHYRRIGISNSRLRIGDDEADSAVRRVVWLSAAVRERDAKRVGLGAKGLR